jgi:hypothetical protein
VRLFAVGLMAKLEQGSIHVLKKIKKRTQVQNKQDAWK